MNMINLFTLKSDGLITKHWPDFVPQAMGAHELPCPDGMLPHFQKDEDLRKWFMHSRGT